MLEMPQFGYDIAGEYYIKGNGNHLGKLKLKESKGKHFTMPTDFGRKNVKMKPMLGSLARWGTFTIYVHNAIFRVFFVQLFIILFYWIYKINSTERLFIPTML